MKTEKISWVVEELRYFIITVMTKTVASHVCLLMDPVKSTKTHFSVTCTSAKFNSNILLSNAICRSDQSSFVKNFCK